MYEKLPSELKENAVFCLWKYEERDGNITKVLYQINGKHGDSTKRGSPSHSIERSRTNSGSDSP